MLKRAANASSDPRHIQTGHAEDDNSQDVDASVPAMKRGKAVSDTGNKLHGSGEHDEGGRSDMHGHGEIADGVARDVTVRDEFAPAVEISTQRGETEKRRYGKSECQLADHGHDKPEAGGRFQAVSATELRSKRLVSTAVLMFVLILITP